MRSQQPSGGMVAKQFGILGPLHVVACGRQLELGAHRQRAVLAILLLHADEVVSLDRLIDLLWGEAPPNAATGSLQAYISNLRRVLEPDRGPRQPAQVLVTEAPGYRLRIEHDAVDAFRFERIALEGRALFGAGRFRAAISRLDEALGLWRGDALAEFRFEPFAAVEIARLEELRVVAERDRVEAQLNAGDAGTAVATLERLVAQHPLRERLRALQMLALYRSGRQAEALRAYDAARRFLAEELGLQPGPHLQALFRQVLEQSPALDGPVAVRIDGGLPARPHVLASSPVGATTGAATAGTTTAPAFVGRQAELHALTAALDHAMRGRPRIVLIGGEPGIGKTRLAEEVAARAAELGALVAWGRCHEDEGMPPMWPWVQVVRAVQDEDATAPASLAELLGLDAETDGASTSDFARFRLYDRVRAVVEQRAATSPVAVVLDDLQWADDSSLRLLRYLAVELRAPVLVIATFHEPEATTEGHLPSALADLVRLQHVDRLLMRGLTAGDVAEIVRIDAPIPGGDVGTVATELHRRTAGNPFFVTELVRLLVSEHTLQDAVEATDIPLVVSDVIRRRLGRLPDDVQAMLGVAAVTGHEFSLDVLHAAVGLAAEDAFDILEAAVMARVIVETEPGCYRFSHGLVRETLYADLTPGRRARLHAKVGEAMEAVYGHDLERHASQLAHHFGAARASEPTARYAQLAAEASERSLAYDEAVAHWEAAVAARDEQGGTGADAERARLLLRLAAAHRRAGDVASSAAVHDRALDAAEAGGDLALLADAALAYGEVGLWQVRPYGTVDERVVTAISRLLDTQAAGDGRLHARLLAGLAIALYYREAERERGRELARRATAVARGTGDRALLTATLIELLVMLDGAPDQFERLAVAEELESVLDVNTPFDLSSTARMRLARIRLSAGDATGLEREIAELSQRAEELRHPIARLWTTWARTGVAFLGGRLAEAERLAGAAFELHEELGIWGGSETYALHMAFVWREQDRLGEVSPLVEPLLQQAQHPGAQKLRALFALERGAVGEIEALLGPDPVPRARDFTWLTELCLTAELCAAARLDCVAEIYDTLLPLDGRIVTMDGTYVSLGATSHYLGLLADALGRRDEAIEHLQEGLALNDRVGAIPWSVRSRYHVAQVRRNDPYGKALLTEAYTIAETHGLVAMRHRLHDSLRA